MYVIKAEIKRVLEWKPNLNLQITGQTTNQRNVSFLLVMRVWKKFTKREWILNYIRTYYGIIIAGAVDYAYNQSL